MAKNKEIDIEGYLSNIGAESENDEPAEPMDMVIYEPKDRQINIQITEEEVEQNIKDDYDYSRQTMHHLIRQGNEFLKSALEFADTSPSPRSIEVTSGLIKNLGDMIEKLNLINKDFQELQKKTPVAAQTQNAEQINNIVVAPHELLEMIDNAKSQRNK